LNDHYELYCTKPASLEGNQEIINKNVSGKNVARGCL